MLGIKIILQNVKSLAKYKDNAKKRKKWSNEKPRVQCITLKEFVSCYLYKSFFYVPCVTQRVRSTAAPNITRPALYWDSG